MSQVDFIIYLPLLFWFIVLFVIFYLLMYLYIIPLLYSTLKVKELFFSSLMDDFSLFNLFLEICFFLDNKPFQKALFRYFKFVFIIKHFLNLYNILKLIK